MAEPIVDTDSIVVYSNTRFTHLDNHIIIFMGGYLAGQRRRLVVKSYPLKKPTPYYLQNKWKTGVKPY